MTWPMRASLALICTAASVANADEPPNPYAQTQVIAPAGKDPILGFCVPAGGGLVAVTGAKEAMVAGVRPPDAESPARHRVVWFASDGTEARSVDLDFAATVVGAAPGGGVYVAGDGVVARLTSAGREDGRGATPQGPRNAEERRQFEQSIAEKHEAQLTAYDKQIERLRSTVAELERKAKEAEEADDETPAADEDDEAEARRRSRAARLRMTQAQVARMTAQLRQAEAVMERMRRQNVAQLVEQALRKPRQIRAVSGSGDAVFIVTPEATGYGYALWRLDGRFQNPEKIVSGLTGCCGQMDVQVFGDRLAIAANRKHCVEMASFAGEVVAKVGHRAGGGDDAAGFGGCCNPMNTCVAPDGSLLTSESNGVVKRFDADGEFVEIVGTAQVKGGCKNSAIAIEPDGSRLYYMDVNAGRVLVLTRTAHPTGDAPKQGS